MFLKFSPIHLFLAVSAVYSAVLCSLAITVPFKLCAERTLPSHLSVQLKDSLHSLVMALPFPDEEYVDLVLAH